MAVLVDFSDKPASETAEDLVKSIQFPVLSEFLKKSSFGNLDFQVSTTDKFYRMPSDSGDYNYNEMTTEIHQRYTNDALAATKGEVSFNGTSILFVIPNSDAADTISVTATGFFESTAPDGTVIPGLVTFGGNATFSGKPPVAGPVGISMGLSGFCPSLEDSRGMEGLSLFCPNPGPESDFLAVDKWALGWLEDGGIACLSQPVNTTVTLSPIESGTAAGLDAKLAVVALGNDEYVTAEARTSDLGDGGRDKCGTGVVLNRVRFVEGSLSTDESWLLDSTPSSGGCAGADTNWEWSDAPLAIGDRRSANISVPGTGLGITLLADDNDMYVIRVESGDTGGTCQENATAPTATCGGNHTSATATYPGGTAVPNATTTFEFTQTPTNYGPPQASTTGTGVPGSASIPLMGFESLYPLVFVLFVNLL